VSNDPQTSFLIDTPEIRKRIYRVSRNAGRVRKRLPVLQSHLPVADNAFTPREGLPAGGRAECRTGKRHCEYVRCKWHLFRDDAEHRAGRPGLANVPRDSAGLTLAAPGHAGHESAGTTLRPAWLKVRGLEVEREVKLYVSTGADGGYEFHEIRHGTLDYWRAHVHRGERLRVFDGDGIVSAGHLRADGAIELEVALPVDIVYSPRAIRLVRVRPIESCALDLIERGQVMSNEQVGDAIGRHRTLVARVVKGGAGRVLEAGMDLRDIVDSR
jgi:hypothetical protein